MPTYRTGGCIGKRLVPAVSGASGCWRMGEVDAAQRDGLWPSVQIDPLPVTTNLLLRINAGANYSVFDSVTGGATLPSGGAVARIEDISGNGYHATQATPANQPVWGPMSFAGDRFGLAFGGGAYRLFNTNLAALGTGDYTIMTVLSADSTAPGTSTAALVGYNGGNNQGLLWNSVNGWRSAPARIGGIFLTTTAPTLAANTLYLFTGVRSGSTFSHFINTSATTPATATVTQNIVDGYTLGQAFVNGGWTQAWPGWVAEHIVYNRALSTEELASVESHVMAYWGIS